MAVAGAGAGAEIMVKFGAGAENKYFRLRKNDEYLCMLLILKKLYII